MHDAPQYTYSFTKSFSHLKGSKCLFWHEARYLKLPLLVFFHPHKLSSKNISHANSTYTYVAKKEGERYKSNRLKYLQKSNRQAATHTCSQ